MVISLGVVTVKQLHRLKVESLLASAGSVVTSHPVCGCAQRVTLLHGLVVLVQTPVLGSFKHIYVSVSPRERSADITG